MYYILYVTSTGPLSPSNILIDDIGILQPTEPKHQFAFQPKLINYKHMLLLILNIYETVLATYNTDIISNWEIEHWSPALKTAQAHIPPSDDEST